MRKYAVHTVESLLARTDEYGECRIWTGYVTNKTPMVDRNGKMVSVRRLLVELQNGHITGKFFVAKCGTDNCVCPEHIGQRTTKTHSRAMTKAAKKYRAQRSKSQTLARRKRGDTKLDMDKVREIRASDDSGPVLAAKYGVSRSLINCVKRGAYWKDAANPFAGLM